MSRAMICLALLLAATCPLSSLAGEGVELPKLFGTFKPETGVWSEYAVYEKARNK